MELPASFPSLINHGEVCARIGRRQIPDETVFTTIDAILNNGGDDKEIEFGETKTVFWNFSKRSRFRQDLMEIVARLEPWSYMSFDGAEHESWAVIHRGVLCFESSPEQPRPYVHTRLLEWKLEGGGRIEKDLQYVHKLKAKEEKLRTEYIDALVKYEKNHEIKDVVTALARYMSLKIDTIIKEEYFEKKLSPVLNGSSLPKGCYWLLMDSPDTTSCTTRLLRECLKHAECEMEGKFTDKCVEEFRAEAGYLNMRDVHVPETYETEAAKQFLLRSFTDLSTPRAIATEKARLGTADAARRSNYQMIRREVHLKCPEDQRQIVLALVDLASLASAYDERLRDFRTKTFAVLRDEMLKAKMDLSSTPLSEVFKYAERKI